MTLRKMSHGGDCYRNQVTLDYSINVNPLGIPESLKEVLQTSIQKLEAYPDLHYQKLREGLAKMYHKEAGQVICGNGASELLMAVVHAFQPEKVLLPVPSFSGYQWALEASGAWIDYHIGESSSFSEGRLNERILEEITEDTDLLFLTNPNNPTGRYLDTELLEQICRRCQETETLLVLDECFVELSDDPESRTMIGKMETYPNLLILRAFTKSFAIPGIRLGYLLCQDEKKISALERHLPEWNLSTLAQEVGVAALKETEYLEKSREYIGKARQYLKEELEKMGFLVGDSVTNFMMIRWPGESEEKWLYNKLLERGVLIRDCSDYQGLESGTYRIAVRKREENERFLQILGEILKEG